MASFWDSVKKGLEEGVSAVQRSAKVAREMTEETIKISKLRYSIHGLRNEIQRSFAEIGGEVFEGVVEERDDILEDEKIKELINEVKEFKSRIEEIEAEIEQIRQDSGIEDDEESEEGEEDDDKEDKTDKDEDTEKEDKKEE